jgi:hypothetical protein
MAAATKPGDFVDFRTCELGSAISCWEALGIYWALRSGAPWRHLPDRYSPHTTVTIASSTGGGLAYGADLWLHSLLLTMLPSK